MNIKVNAVPHEIEGNLLSAVLIELGFDNPAIATALNGRFVPRTDRNATTLSEGDQLEILAPMQGG